MCLKKSCFSFWICPKIAGLFWTVNGGEVMQSRVMGYARVSSREQNLDRQLLELKKYVPEGNIVVDKQSGKDLERPGYQALKGALGLRSGDTLYIKSLDRLSRNKADIKGELEWFQKNNIRLMILDLPTSMIQVPAGQEWIIEMINNILIEVLSSIAQQEREMIRSRQREGIDAAKLAGKSFGRPKVSIPYNFSVVVKDWQNGKITAKEAMKLTGLKRSSFYQAVKGGDDK